MALPIRQLPLVQNWECRACGDCCRELEAVITDDEKRRLEALDLAGDPEVGAGPWFSRVSWWSKTWRLKHRPEGGCVFLTSGNRCRLHERFGAEVKPFACRLFPFLLIPAGDHWRVGVRYSCPTAAENKGRPLGDYQGELVTTSQLLEKHVGREGASAEPPALQGHQRVSWPDAVRIADTLVKIVQDRSDPVERRLRKCLALGDLCRQAKFDDVTGGRLGEFLRVLRTGIDAEVPRGPADVPPPGWIGRVLFRVLLAVFARKDRGHNQGPDAKSRLGRVRAGWRFVRGRGRVPRVNTFLPSVTFEQVENRLGCSSALDETLERYYVTKLDSMQFCGPPNFGFSFWTGLDALVLTLPLILWLTRAFIDMPPVMAVQKAILLVDNHFGGNPVLGFWHNRFFLRTLAGRGEIARLAAWYSR